MTGRRNLVHLVELLGLLLLSNSFQTYSERTQWVTVHWNLPRIGTGRPLARQTGSTFANPFREGPAAQSRAGYNGGVRGAERAS